MNVCSEFLQELLMDWGTTSYTHTQPTSWFLEMAATSCHKYLMFINRFSFDFHSANKMSKT